MLVTSIFTFSHHVFYPSKSKFQFLIHIWIVVCKIKALNLDQSKTLSFGIELYPPRQDLGFNEYYNSSLPITNASFNWPWESYHGGRPAVYNTLKPDWYTRLCLAGALEVDCGLCFFFAFVGLGGYFVGNFGETFRVSNFGLFSMKGSPLSPSSIWSSPLPLKRQRNPLFLFFFFFFWGGRSWKFLTLYHTMTTSDIPEEMPLLKTLLEREKMLVNSIFSFPTMFSTLG